MPQQGQRPVVVGGVTPIRALEKRPARAKGSRHSGHSKAGRAAEAATTQGEYDAKRIHHPRSWTAGCAERVAPCHARKELPPEVAGVQVNDSEANNSLDPKGRGDKSMLESGEQQKIVCCGPATPRAIRRRLDCLHPTLQGWNRTRVWQHI